MDRSKALKEINKRLDDSYEGKVRGRAERATDKIARYAFLLGAEWAEKELVHNPGDLEITKEELAHQLYGAKNLTAVMMEAVLRHVRLVFGEGKVRIIDVDEAIESFRKVMEGNTI